MAAVIVTNMTMVKFNLRNYYYMMLAEAFMVVCVLAIPALCLASGLGLKTQFSLWVVLILVNAISSGINQTMSFSFGAESGSVPMKMIAIGQAVGGMIISIMCLLCSLSIHSEHEIFGVIFSNEGLSNLI